MANFTDEEILNTIRSGASQDYQQGIPEAISENVTAIGNSITSDENVPSMNEFCDILVNKFFRTYIKESQVDNRLSRFNRGKVTDGMTVQEIFVNQAKNTADVTRKRTYDGKGGATTFFETDPADVKALYYEMNRSEQYDTYFNRSMLKAAFNGSGLDTFIGSISNSIVKGNEHDEYIFGKELLSSYAGDGDTIQGYKTYSVPDFIYHQYTSDADIESAAKKLISTLRGAALDMQFNSSEYNGAGVDTLTKPEDLVLFLHKDIAKYVDVYALANAFNMSKEEFIGDVIYLDDFGSNPLMAGCQAILCDKRFLNIWDNERIMTNQFFGNDLKETLWYTVRQTGYCLPFVNACCFIADITTYDVEYKDGNTSLKKFTVPENTKTPTIANPTKEGYVFDGWQPDVAATVTADATYSAQWEQKSVEA